MILIIDLCWKAESLSKPEFVDPIANIIKASGRPFKVIHHLAMNYTNMEKVDAIILCGTALKDNNFRENNELIDFIRKTNIPVLGICAGMQIVALAYEGKLVNSVEIGMRTIKISKNDEIFDIQPLFEAYKQHGMRIITDENFIVVAESDNGAEAIRHISKPVWGVLFHPEVRNEWVINNFIEYNCRT